MFISSLHQHLSPLMHARTHPLHFFPCSSLLNSISHHLSGVSYSICSFCVQIISPMKLLGFLDIQLQKKCTYVDQINGEVQQTLKKRLRGWYTSRSYCKIMSWNHTPLDPWKGMYYTLHYLQGLMGNYLLNIALRKCCLVKHKLWGQNKTVSIRRATHFSQN